MLIDKNGEPMIWFHTGGDWTKLNDEGINGKGKLMFSPTKSSMAYGRDGKQTITRPFFIKSDFIYMLPYEDRDTSYRYRWNKNKKNPIWFVNAYGGFIVVRQSNQIKLADGTNTTLDGENPDIRYAGGGKIPNVNHKNIQGKQFIYDGGKFLIVDFPNKSGTWNKGATWRKTAKHHCYIIKLDDIETNLDKHLFDNFIKPRYVYDDYWLQFNGNPCRSIEGTSTKLIDTLNYEIYEREKRENNSNINNNRGGVR